MGLFRKFRSFTAEWGWEEIVPSSGSEPSGDRSGALFTRNGSGVFVLHGGRNSSNFDTSDVWTFNATAKTWTQVTASSITTVYPTGYADGSNTLYVLGVGKINLTNGSTTSITTTGDFSSGRGSTFADAANTRIYSSIPGSLNYYVSDGTGGLTNTQQNLSANTSVRTALDVGLNSPRTSFLQSSSMALYPSNNTLYMVGPVTTYTSNWSLGSSSWIKYSLTTANGWVQESGVTNNAGSVAMPYFSANNNQLIWCAAESKFFLFVSNGRVITYDPSSKVISEALFDGSFPTGILGADNYSEQRGNAGTVVVTGSEFFFIKTGGTNARIWKFRRN